MEKEFIRFKSIMSSKGYSESEIMNIYNDEKSLYLNEFKDEQYFYDDLDYIAGFYIEKNAISDESVSA